VVDVEDRRHDGNDLVFSPAAKIAIFDRAISASNAKQGRKPRMKRLRGAAVVAARLIRASRRPSVHMLCCRFFLVDVFSG
jgi:hypothetical protein